MQVHDELDHAYKDVIGVPHTVINGTIRLGGAQEVSVYRRVFQQLLEEAKMSSKMQL